VSKAGRRGSNTLHPLPSRKPSNVNRRVVMPADLGPLSGCAAELAEAFVSLSSDIALIIDAQGIVRNVAQNLNAPIVPQAGDWVGRPWADTASADTRRKIELMLDDLQSTGLARRREINLSAQSDGGVPVSFAALRLGEQGPVLAVGKDLRAVSAVQQRFLDAQQELERGYWRARQAESRYRLLFQVATDAVLTVDARSLRVIEGNHAAANLLGAGLPLAGRPATELFERSSRAALHELLLNAGSSGKPAEVQVRMPKTQALAAVAATPFRSGDGLRLLLRVRFAAGAEPGGADLNKTLALLVDNTRDGVVVTDSSGRILLANPAFLALVDGLGEDEARGRAIKEWLGRIEADVATLLAGAHQHGIAHLVRSSLRQRSGGQLDVDITTTLLAEGDQECFGFTIRPCAAKVPLPDAWLQGLVELDALVGRLSLPELMAGSQQLSEQRFVSEAMSRTHGDVPAAARLLGIGVDELAQCLERAGTLRPDAPKPSR
jgi:transcriptional regulator PpsR